MIELVIDSGGSGSDWALLSHKTRSHLFSTPGMHPSKAPVADILAQATIDHPAILAAERIWLYGTGVTSPQIIKVLEDLFSKYWPKASMAIHTDMLGAARGLCQARSGIVCILGTGSNSCYYDGTKIQKSIPSGGYLLGDEGSGFHIGKVLLIKYLRGLLSTKTTGIIEQYLAQQHINIYDDIYQSKQPNRLIASFSKIVATLPMKEQDDILIPLFKEFVAKRILPLTTFDKDIYFTGSIAFHFKKQLLDALNSFNLQARKIEPKPIGALVDYHIAYL